MSRLACLTTAGCFSVAWCWITARRSGVAERLDIPRLSTNSQGACCAPFRHYFVRCGGALEEAAPLEENADCTAWMVYTCRTAVVLAFNLTVCNVVPAVVGTLFKGASRPCDDCTGGVGATRGDWGNCTGVVAKCDVCRRHGDRLRNHTSTVLEFAAPGFLFYCPGRLPILEPIRAVVYTRHVFERATPRLLLLRPSALPLVDACCAIKDTAFATVPATPHLLTRCPLLLARRTSGVAVERPTGVTGICSAADLVPLAAPGLLRLRPPHQVGLPVLVAVVAVETLGARGRGRCGRRDAQQPPLGGRLVRLPGAGVVARGAVGHGGGRLGHGVDRGGVGRDVGRVGHGWGSGGGLCLLRLCRI
mmetsp:Transcript_104704/g.273340  ORF Transcript_104704/g.273340 Transcript_104704/m.273340 type:complete len:362 (-) Transcript_104704:412-1497(-)